MTRMMIHHRHLSSTSGAVAVGAGVLSGLVSVIVMFTAPHGFRRFAVALHVARQPMLVRIAPFIAAFAVMAAAIAAVLRLYSWGREVGARRSEAASSKQQRTA
jgi:hypothetical protein